MSTDELQGWIDRYTIILDRLKRLGEMHTAIVELHAPLPIMRGSHQWHVCAGCTQGGHPGDDESPEWPCATAQLILDRWQ